MEEKWKPVVGFEGLYEVSSIGRVRKADKSMVLKCNPDFLGYVKVGFNVNGKYYTNTVHRLVASAFIPNPKSKPHVHHIDHNKLNNRAENLMWCTPKEHGALKQHDSTFGERYRARMARRKALREKNII